MADSKTDIKLVPQLVIKYLTLFHIVTGYIFSQFKTVNFFLLMLGHVLLPNLFHIPKFPYGSHLYVGVIQIEIFCLKFLEKFTDGKKHFFLDFVTRMNLNLHSLLTSFPLRGHDG